MGRKVKHRPDHGGKNQFQELSMLLHQVQDQRLRAGQTLNSISKMHDKSSSEQKTYASFRTKLKSLFSNALCETQQEVDIIQKALNKIVKLKGAQKTSMPDKPEPRKAMRRGVLMTLLHQKATQLPCWEGSAKDTPPPLTGTVPADPVYICQSGNDVAALCDDVEDDTWILAEVCKFDNNLNRYQVKDIEDIGETGQGENKHMLSRRRIIPLPIKKLNPLTHASLLYQPRHKVLALFPQTTCFYPAIIHKPPASESEDYQVMFIDNNYAEGYAPPLGVPQRYVIDYKDKKRK